MRLTRTQFVGSVLATFAAAFAAPRSLFAAAPQRAVKGGLGLATFTGLLQTAFRVEGADHGLSSDFVLVGANDRGSTKMIEQFTLEFVSPGGVATQEGTYGLYHPTLGAFDLYIAPTRKDKGGRQTFYRADFCLLR